MRRVIERAPFPDCMTDIDKIQDVLACDVVMTELGVPLEDRAFMLVLSDMANDTRHFVDMLKRLSDHFARVVDPSSSSSPSSRKELECDPRTHRGARLCT
jgi:hypothetical protein